MDGTGQWSDRRVWVPGSGRNVKRRASVHSRAMAKARLYAIPASHPSYAASLMLERKGIPYSRVDLLLGEVQQQVVYAAHRAVTTFLRV